MLYLFCAHFGVYFTTSNTSQLVPASLHMFNCHTQLRPPPRWRIVTTDWAQDSHNTALLPHHQPIRKKVTYPAALIPNLVQKNYSLKIIREFSFFDMSHKPPILLVWPCNKPFSALKKREREFNQFTIKRLNIQPIF